MSKHNFYKIDDSNIVKDGIVVDSADCFTDGVYDESKGSAFCVSIAGAGTWVGSPQDVAAYQGSACLNAEFNNDIFKNPSPYPTFVWNESTLTWDNPVANPEPGNDMVFFNYQNGLWTNVTITGDPGTTYNSTWDGSVWVKDDASEQPYDSSTLPPNPYA